MSKIGTKTSVDNFEIFYLKESLLNFLNIKENFLYGNFSDKYSEIKKPKKNGGIRIIRPPFKKLKKVQRLILDEILIKEQMLPCIYGLSKNKGILANAKIHNNKNHQLLVLDLKEYFPSINKKRVLKIFKKLGFSHENALILTKICTVNNELPQGAPTSPYISSLVSKKMDKDIFNYCRKRGLIYTRYFDDISISGKNITEKYIKSIEKIIKKNSFILNENKKYLFKKDEEKVLNGILLKSDSLSVPDLYKEKIKKQYLIFKKTKDIRDERIFKGLFGFFLYINKKEAISFLKILKNL